MLKSLEDSVRIFLLRHAQSQGNVDPSLYRDMADHAIPLSAGGQAQAREAGRRIKEHLQAIHGEPGSARVRMWTSPYERTRQTGDVIVEAAGGWVTDRREHILLCEQQFGLFNGVPDDQLPVRFPDEYALHSKQEQAAGKFWVRFPLGESRFDVATRVHQAFGTFHRDLRKHGIEDLIVVCHGVTLRAFVMMWCHYSPEWFETEGNPGNCAIRLIEGSEDRGYIFEGFEDP